MYYAIAGIVFFASFAMSVQTGLWANLVTLLSILVGGIVALGVYQPIVILIDEQTGGSYTYLLDIFVIWLVFAITTGLLKQFAGMLSRNRVNFPEQFDNYGGAGVGLIIAYAMMCFTMSTFHAAPLAYDMMGGAYEYGTSPEEAQSKLSGEFGPLKPQIAWLQLSESVLSPDALGGAGFSSKIFLSQYGKHRKTFQSLDSSIVKR